jgi:hypothetical protein
MNKFTYHRRGLIKRGLTLLGGVFFLGTLRSSFAAATKMSEPVQTTNRVRRVRGLTQNCIEAVSLPLPVAVLETNEN